jgi:mannose-1-phosphate guanylyltransferase
MVVTEAQREYVSQWSPVWRRGRVVFQPEDRGTAASVLFGLVTVLTTDPTAVVLITPSDHAVANPDVFRRGILDAMAHVKLHGGVVLFGVEPSTAEPECGWMTLRSLKPSKGVQSVASFVEQPPVEASSPLTSGAVWNTRVVVARARALLDLCREHLPEVTRVFIGALTVPPDTREKFLAKRYPHLETAEFSRHVLTNAVNLLAYTWPATIGWSDLGTPERIRSWLRTVPVERFPINAALSEAVRAESAGAHSA